MSAFPYSTYIRYEVIKLIVFKRAFFIFILSLYLLFFCGKQCFAYDINYKYCNFYNDKYTPPKGSVEETYKDIAMRLLASPISEAIKNYYGQYLLFDLATAKILDIQRPLGYRSFEFIIKIELKPFIDAHNVVGIDIVTIRIREGIPTVESFEHIKSFNTISYFNLR